MTWSSGSWNPAPPLGWRMPITWNGRPPIVIWRADGLGVEPEVVGGRGAEHRDPQALVDRGVGQERPLPDVVGADLGVVGADVPTIEVVVVFVRRRRPRPEVWTPAPPRRRRRAPRWRRRRRVVSVGSRRRSRPSG